MSETQEEKTLSLQALKAGDRAEFSKLVDLYSSSLFRLALRILGDPQDAEDVLQETFLKAYRALPSFEGRSSLSTWLYRIVTNEALMVIRRAKPDLLWADDEEENSEAISPSLFVDWDALPEQELLSHEVKQFLDQAVQQLSANLRIVFLLRDVVGLSVKETAEQLGLSEVAVKTRLLRARLRLREELSAYFGERFTGK
ncbi:MAG: sigma-70 family RNA polymerase sigma factor [Chloroflexi bacterium]|nr:sigma-70 family RNA polymerase sigma factor [Chloroflexota bacterium]